MVSAELAALKPARTWHRSARSCSRRSAAPAISSPLLRLPADDLCYAFNLIRIPATDDAARGRPARGRPTAATYERVTAAGGTLYPVSAFPMSRDDWREHFGPASLDSTPRSSKFDPGNVLTPGYEIY